MNKATMITGADGYLGLRVAKRLLLSATKPVVLWVRSQSPVELDNKTAILKASLTGAEERFSIHTGDLSNDQCFSSIDADSIDNIIHCAAVTRFNVDAETAQSVNVDGTRRLLAFARQCPSLERLVYVSSIYACGMKAGPIVEEPIGEEAGFANHYERSKWSAERILIDGAEAVAWSIVRVATVLADDESGHVTQYNAVHNTLKLLFYGLMSVLPGIESTPLYLVTGDFAADSVLAAAHHGQPSSIYHACYRKEECMTLGEFVDLAHETFETDASFKRRRVLKPLYTDLDAFNLLSDAANGFGEGIMKQALASVAPFARQLYIEKDVHNDKLRQLLGAAYQPPDAATLVRNTCKSLVESKWGKTAEVAVF